nr:synaptojanin-2-like [Chelonoidis abingdonii]
MNCNTLLCCIAGEINLLDSDLSAETKVKHTWTPGALMYYGRAELQASDHRPVLAIVEVEVQEVDVAARESVFQEVSSFQGPLDATVMVNLQSPTPEETNEFPEDLRTELMQIFENYGTIVLVRINRGQMMVTFADSRSALSVLDMDRIKVKGRAVNIRPKTKDWLKGFQEEIARKRESIAPMSPTANSCLLEENFDFSSLDYESEGDILDDEEDYLDDMLPQHPGAEMTEGLPEGPEYFTVVPTVTSSKSPLLTARKPHPYKDDADLAELKQELEVGGGLRHRSPSRSLSVPDRPRPTQPPQRPPPPAGISVKKSPSAGSLSSGGHTLCSILQTAKLLPGAPQQPPKARTGISKPYNVKQIKTTTAQEAEEAIRCLMEAKGGTQEDALKPAPVRTQTFTQPDSLPSITKSASFQGSQPGPMLVPHRPPPKVPTVKKPVPLQRTGVKSENSVCPEEQLDQQPVRFHIGLSESCPETRAVTSPTRITPIPKPRTTMPGKAPERSSSSSNRQPPSPGTSEESALPLQNSFAPKVPPRRKKSAPAALHQQVLQSSNSLLLSGLTFNSNNNNSPSEYHPPIQDSDILPVSHRDSDLSAPTPTASPDSSGTKHLTPTAVDFIVDLQGPPAPDIQQPQLLDTNSLTESANLLDLDTDVSFPFSIPATTNPTHTLRYLKLPTPKDFSHWVTFSDDEDNGTLSDGVSKLLVLEQNKNTWMDTNANLEL